MKLLVLGGTVFLGRHVVEAALAHGHDVTLFNRGQHNPELFPEAEKLRGDRDGDMEALNGRAWDAVVDTCGYVPRLVRRSAQRLADVAGHYTFISSISVYADFSRPQRDENAPLGTLEDESVEEVTNQTYGPLKVLCEGEAQRAFPGRALIIRPGLIVGPHDPSDRFTYWPVRAARGGEALVPGIPEQRVECIDVRDLAEWNVQMIEAGKTGVYNATGPAEPLTMQGLLDACNLAGGAETRFTYVPAEFLKAHDTDPNRVNTWCIPEEEVAFRYIFDIDCSRAKADGLPCRPLLDTVRDTLNWHRQRPADTPLKVGLEAEREKELLEAWKSKR